MQSSSNSPWVPNFHCSEILVAQLKYIIFPYLLIHALMQLSILVTKSRNEIRCNFTLIDPGFSVSRESDICF